LLVSEINYTVNKIDNARMGEKLTREGIYFGQLILERDPKTTNVILFCHKITSHTLTR